MGKNIEPLLHSVGVSPCYIGYRYFISAVEMAAADVNRLTNIKKEIYIPLAEKYNVSLSSLEKSIRTIRDVIVRNNGKVLLEHMAGYKLCHDNLPYPRELIGMFAYYMQKP